MTYEAFIFLNNVALSLLEHQQYQESMETFQDAIHVYHSICVQKKKDPNKQQTTDIEESSSKILTQHKNERSIMMTQEILRGASERLAHSIQSHHSTTTTKTTTMIQSNIDDVMIDPIIVLDSTNDDCFSTILKYGSAIDQIDFVIRMNDDLLLSYNNNDYKLYYLILLLNYGVACKRSSEVIDDDMLYNFSDELKETFREESTDLFYIANCISTEELMNLTIAVKMRTIPNRQQDHILILLYTTIVSMFTSSHMSDIMYWRHSTDEGMKYYTKFEKSFQFFQMLIKVYMKRPGSTITGGKHAASA